MGGVFFVLKIGLFFKKLVEFLMCEVYKKIGKLGV